MRRTVLATVLIAATTLTAPTAIAEPDASDIAKTIAGVAAVALVLKGLSDHRDKKDRAETKVSGHTLAERIGSGRETVRRVEPDTRIIDGRVRPVEQSARRGKGQGYKNKPLPAACRVYVETNRGSRLAYASRCLHRNYVHTKRLPDHCEALIRDSGHALTAVYGARCLSRDGWRVAMR